MLELVQSKTLVLVSNTIVEQDLLRERNSPGYPVLGGMVVVFRVLEVRIVHL